MEHPLTIRIVVDDPIGISVIRAISLIRHELGSRGSLLLGLDIVGSALRVESTGSGRVVAGDDEGEDVVRDDRGESFESGCADTVGAIDGEGGEEVTALLWKSMKMILEGKAGVTPKLANIRSGCHEGREDERRESCTLPQASGSILPP